MLVGNYLKICGIRIFRARLESVYTSKAYRGFESPSLRTESCKSKDLQDFFIIILACPSKRDSGLVDWKEV